MELARGGTGGGKQSSVRKEGRATSAQNERIGGVGKGGGGNKVEWGEESYAVSEEVLSKDKSASDTGDE